MQSIKMMHLQFPKKREFYSWVELSCLSRALGFPSETIKNCIPDELTNRQDGISYKDILKLIELKYFNDALDRSVNMHTADYNINTLLQSLKLLNHTLLSFSELNDVRIAFQIYEAGDMRGMVIDTHTQLRALKLCDRTIAPMKLMHRIKHLQTSFDEPGRIQLYEFLNLIVICELTKDIDVPDFKYGALDKTWRRLFKLDNIKDVCITKDTKVEQHLNKQFRDTELNYGREQLASKSIPRESAVDITQRIRQVRHHNKKYHELQGFMGQSTIQVQRTKAGHIRSQPVSPPEIDKFRFPSPPHSVPLTRPQTMSEFTPRTSVAGSSLAPSLSVARSSLAPSVSPRSLHLNRPRSAPTSALSHQSRQSQKHFSCSDSSVAEDPRLRLLQILNERRSLGSLQTSSSSANTQSSPSGLNKSTEKPWKSLINSYVRPETPRVVTDHDVEQRQHVLNGIQYQIETLEERTLQKFEQEMKAHLPEYYQRKKETVDAEDVMSRTLSPTRSIKKKKKTELISLPPESIERLVNPTARQYHDTHDKNCDARCQDFDTLKNSRKSGAKVKEKNPVNAISKPPVLLDSRRLSIASDKNIETASTRSSAAESSIAKTTDLTSNSLPSNSVLSLKQQRVSSQQAHDPEKFKEYRVGTAAVLHSFFSDAKKESSRNTSTKHGMETKTEKDTELLSGSHQQSSENNNNTKHSKSRSSLFCSTTKKNPARPGKNVPPDPRLSRWDKARINRKFTLLEEEELKINGVSLSEIDRLTFKDEEDKLCDLSIPTKLIGHDISVN